MSLVIDGVYYTSTHEWVRVEGETAIVGLTDYAQRELGDIVLVELPKVGGSVDGGKPCATVEAVKAVSDIYAPVSGIITEVNESLKNKVDIIKKDPYGEGWIFKIKISSLSEISNLISPEEYKKLIGE